MRLAYQHHGNRRDARDLLRVAAEQQPIHAATPVGAQDDQITRTCLGLLGDLFRHALGTAFKKHRLHGKSVLTQSVGGLIQQGLSSRHEARTDVLDVDLRTFETRAVSGRLDDMQQDHRAATQMGQSAGMIEGQKRCGTAVQRHQES